MPLNEFFVSTNYLMIVQKYCVIEISWNPITHSTLELLGGAPELQFTSWVDAVIFVFSLENETSFNAIYNYYAKMSQFRSMNEIPLILVGTQDSISEDQPRLIEDSRYKIWFREIWAQKFSNLGEVWKNEVQYLYPDLVSKKHPEITLKSNFQKSVDGKLLCYPSRLFEGSKKGFHS